MKKNYRFVSAAAAALLTVAPVVAGAVSPVFADTTNTTNGSVPVSVNGNGTATSTAKSIVVTLNIDNATSLTEGPASAVKASLTTNAGKIAIPNDKKANIYKASDVNKDGTVKAGATPVQKIEKGGTYIAVLQQVQVGNLDANANVTVNGQARQTDGFGSITRPVTVNSSVFTVQDSSKTGTPYFLDGKNKQVSSIKVPIVKGASDSVDGITSYIVSNFKISSTGTASVSEAAYESAVKSAIQSALATNGITIKSDGTFDVPAADFVAPITVTADNGKTATLTANMKVSSNSNDKLVYPVIWLNQKSYMGQNQTIELTSANKKDFASTSVNGTVDESKIENAFVATVNGHTTNTLSVKADISKVNTKVAGVYPVTVTATNADGLTSSVVFNFTVGDPNADYKTVQSDTDIPVYTINGNNVTKTTTTVANGTQVATYGQITANGTKYMRINSADSNQYVESKYVDGSYKPQKQSTVTVMHNAYIYDKDHKRVGTKKISSYTNTTVYGDKTKLNDGTDAYMIADGQYIDAGNVDGYKVTLNHNSYIYKTSKKRANHKKLLKGSTVTVYGSSFTFKNGQKYYRIGKGQYIKVVNADIVK
ncbi:SLAP domain-containing protein [Lactobacillus sp. ESL0677]|uniref:SLAP domain-containing protein n=1 Tax=Lactobacillus sp. ESL0677 TaxID=2983208 RepID=UPI0023F9F311|nr:SLAP domain-containing protein [Lactobacillus sp. ESL0677]WEV36848.1 SLAP domain-containing protein [Lactobacillus sp. ESL0677]